MSLATASLPFLAEAPASAPLVVCWEDLRGILPPVVLFAAGGATLLLDVFLYRRWRTPTPGVEKPVLHFAALLGTVVAAAFTCLEFQTAAERGAPGVLFGGALRADTFSWSIAMIILVGTFLALMAAADSLHRHGIEDGEFHCLVLSGAGSMILFAQAGNLIMLFLALETLSLAVYVLAAFTRDERRSVEGGFKYFVLGSFSSGFLLLGLAFIYGATGELGIDGVAARVQAGGVDPWLFVAGLSLAFVGLGFKVGAFPFHTWLPDAYEGAPAVVTGFMAATVKAAAFAVLLRLALAWGSGAQALALRLVPVLAFLAVATMVFGNLVALVQESVKRMFAYSAIAHTGYLLVGVVAALSSGRSGPAAAVVFYLIPYSLMTVAAFGLLTYLGSAGRDRERYGDYRGLARERPLVALGLLVLLVSFAGIPPSAGFWAKLYVFKEAVVAGHWELALVGVLASVVSVYYYLRLAVSCYMQPGEGPFPLETGERLGGTLVLAAAAVAVVVIGLVPGFCFDLAARSVAHLSVGG